MAKYATVDAYIAALPEPLGAVATAARQAIDAAFADGSAAIKWAHPTWSLGKDPVCYLKAASRHVTFGFWRGATIADASGRLESAGERMAHVKLRSLADIDAALFADWLRQARAMTEAGAGGAPAASVVRPVCPAASQRD